MLFDIIALQTCKYCVKLANACLNIEDMPSGRGYQETYSQEFGLASIGSLDDHFNLLHNLSFKIISQLVCQ